MTTPATRRLLLAGLSLAAAALACARAEVPIVPAGLAIVTPQMLPPTASEPPLVLATSTSELAEGTRGPATSTATDAPPPTATAPVTFASVPLPNGTFDTDLSGWNLTPNWTLWQDGYARLNAAQAGPGAVLVQITNVPQASEVRLAFSARSEDARGGECLIRSQLDTLSPIPADGEWHPLEVDFSLAAGTQTAVSLQARNNSHCEWVNIDDVRWLVPAEPGSVADATATPGEASDATATTEPSATPPPASATLSAIPANALFMQDFTVTAVGDSPVGAPADLRDGQTITWASLRNGTGAWVFDLGSTHTVAGLRVVAHRDGNQDTTILGIDVSADGAAWTQVYRAAGTCGSTANCQVIEQGTPVELPISATPARYVRVRSGPTRFALAEVEVAVAGN